MKKSLILSKQTKSESECSESECSITLSDSECSITLSESECSITLKRHGACHKELFSNLGKDTTDPAGLSVPERGVADASKEKDPILKITLNLNVKSVNT